jgi:hypothetical protein
VCSAFAKLLKAGQLKRDGLRSKHPSIAAVNQVWLDRLVMATFSLALKRLLAQAPLLASTDRQDGADRSKEIEPQNTQNTQRAAVE